MIDTTITLSKGINFNPISSLSKGYESLSKKEQKYYRIMFAQSGVLYISSPPGFAKTAMLRNIAKKMGFQYFDIRLSMVDETDVGLYPRLENLLIRKDGSIISNFTQNSTILEEGEVVGCLSHVAPKWAYMANTRPTIIHFEELNRSSLAVRNAALQMLLEREIGTFFRFNDNVLMCASGNLGEDDKTDVEEFDTALNNRLIHIEHKLKVEEWTEQYAEENVCPVIVQFLNLNQDYYHKTADDKSKNKAYATPRSWTFMSDYIFKNYGKWVTKLDNNGDIIIDSETGEPKLFKKFPELNVWFPDIEEIGHGYVGQSNGRFVRYCQDTLKISLDDVLNEFDKNKDDIVEFNRDKKSELLSEMKKRKIFELNKSQLENLIRFLQTITDDEVVAYLLHAIDNEFDVQMLTNEVSAVGYFLADERFDKFRNAIYKHVYDGEDKNKNKNTTQPTNSVNKKYQ